LVLLLLLLVSRRDVVAAARRLRSIALRRCVCVSRGQYFSGGGRCSRSAEPFKPRPAGRFLPRLEAGLVCAALVFLLLLVVLVLMLMEVERGVPRAVLWLGRRSTVFCALERHVGLLATLDVRARCFIHTQIHTHDDYARRLDVDISVATSREKQNTHEQVCCVFNCCCSCVCVAVVVVVVLG